MVIIECQIIEPFRAPKNNRGTLSFRQFKMGEKVRGTVVNHGQTPLNYVPALKTTDGYIIPESHLNVLGQVEEVQEAQEIKNTDYINKNTKAKAGAVGKSITSGDLGKVIQERSKYVVYGAMLGVAVGLGYSIWKGKNKMMFATLGALAGALGGNVYHKAIKK